MSAHLDIDDDDDDDLVALIVPLPHHPLTGSEIVWGELVAGDQFVVRSVPHYAYGLNHQDIVIARIVEGDRQPQVQEVVCRSGHRTLRVTFCRGTKPRERFPMLDELRAFGVSYDGSSDGQIAVDVPPSGDLESVLWQLEVWQATDKLVYENAEARVPGSFDDAPDEEAADDMRAMWAAMAAHRDQQLRTNR